MIKHKPLLNIEEKEKTKIELSSNELAAVGIIQSWEWKKGASRTVWEAAHESVTNYNKWYKKLCKTKISNGRLYKFRSYLIPLLPSEYTLLINWFKYVQKTRTKKRDFSGDLKNHVWHKDNDWWKSIGYQYAAEWCDDSFLWDELIKLMKE